MKKLFLLIFCFNALFAYSLEWPNTQSWSLGFQISSSSTQGATTPKVAMNSNGEAVAVWNTNSNGGTGNIYVSRRSSSGAWSPQRRINVSTTLPNATTNLSLSPQVAINEKGEAIVVWQTGPGDQNIYAARLDSNGNWSEEELINSGAFTINFSVFPQVALNDQGEAGIAWLTFLSEIGDNKFGLIYFKKLNRDGTWDNQQQLTSIDNPLFRDPKVALNNSGKIVVAWQAFGSTPGSISVGEIFATTSFDGKSWSSAQLISAETPNANSSLNHQITINQRGDALVTWQTLFSILGSAAVGNIFVNSQTPDGTWSTSTRINNQSQITFNNSLIPQLTIAPYSKAAAVVWQNALSGSDLTPGNIFAASRNSNGTWSSDLQINLPRKNTSSPNLSLNIAVAPYVSMNEHNQVMATYYSSTTLQKTGSIFVVSRDSYNNWSKEQRVNFNPSQGELEASSLPRITLNNRGDSVVVWQKSPDTNTLIFEACFYSPTAVLNNSNTDVFLQK